MRLGQDHGTWSLEQSSHLKSGEKIVCSSRLHSGSVAPYPTLTAVRCVVGRRQELKGLLKNNTLTAFLKKLSVSSDGGKVYL